MNWITRGRIKGEIHSGVTLCRHLDGFAPQFYDSCMLATEGNFLAELERVVRGERPTVDPRALLFVAAEVILEGRKADNEDLQRMPRVSDPGSNLIPFPSR